MGAVVGGDLEAVKRSSKRGGGAADEAVFGTGLAGSEPKRSSPRVTVTEAGAFRELKMPVSLSISSSSFAARGLLGRPVVAVKTAEGGKLEVTSSENKEEVGGAGEEAEVSELLPLALRVRLEGGRLEAPLARVCEGMCVCERERRISSFTVHLNGLQ